MGELLTWPDAFPELTTPRLRLRALRPDDAGELLRILGDEQVTRYHSMPTLVTLAEAQAALASVQDRYTAREMIRWAIEPVGNGSMIGTVGLLHIQPRHRRAEVGYELARRWWGRGLASEAVAAVVSYGFARLGLHRIEAGVLPGNARSVRVLEHLGFREEGTLRDHLYLKGRFHHVRWFGLLESDAPPG